MTTEGKNMTFINDISSGAELSTAFQALTEKWTYLEIRIEVPGSKLYWFEALYWTQLEKHIEFFCGEKQEVLHHCRV